MSWTKLQEKLFNRIGMKVLHGTESGIMCTFHIHDNKGNYTVEYLIEFKDRYEWIHESEVTFLKGTEI
ncbi:hypothetical protein ABEX38_29785 [Priestia megaterium]